jgi:hypothetical protein
MTPKKSWISGKITISAAALFSALVYGLPKVLDVLDTRYALKAEITALRAEIKDLRVRNDSATRELKVCIRHPEDCR